MLRHKRTKFLLLGSASQVTSRAVVFLVSYLITAITFRYFSAEEFGLWAITTSLIVFTTTLDFGTGQALRNKLAQLSISSSAEDEKYFFSVFYVFLTIVIAFIALVYISRFFIPISILIRTNNPEIINVAGFVVPLALTILLLNIPFSFSLVGFLSYQETYWTSISEILRALSAFIAVSVAVLLKSQFSSVVSLYFLSILLVSVATFYWFLRIRKWELIVLSIRSCISKIKNLMGQSILFGILQVSNIVVAYTDTIIAGKMFGLEETGEYNVVFKLFMVLNIAHIAILTPLWSAFTEAVELKDYAWVNRAFLYSIVFTLLFFGIGIVGLLIFAKKLLYFWVGKEVGSSLLMAVMGVWSLSYGWKACFSTFLTGTGNIKVQTLLDAVSAIIVIPLSVFLGHKIGIVGICLAKVIATVPCVVSNPIQCLVILNRYRTDIKCMCVKN